MIRFFAQGGYPRLFPARFPLPWFLRIQFIAPSIKLSSRYPSSFFRATMLSQPLIRSTATCRKWSEYRLFATRSFLSCKVCLLLLSHFWGSLQNSAPTPPRSSAGQVGNSEAYAVVPEGGHLVVKFDNKTGPFSL